MSALYRKYRPKTLKEIYGQESTVSILQSAAKQNRFSHAYLFYGSRGTGKTTMARLVAKIVNCEKRLADPEFAQKAEPCNECSLCVGIDTLSAYDVIEIDAASNRGIDEIRNLKENIKSVPAYATKKVFIIDEVHMLTTPAFNALLKTLEEPPAHALFILATTEFEKVPATITSRTQRFYFRKLTVPEIIHKLENMCTAESITYTKEGLEMIALLAEGALRDAESILEQVASFKNDISSQSVEDLLGKVSIKKVTTLLKHCVAQDSKEVLGYIHQLHNEGCNLFELNKDITEYLRLTLSLKLNPSLQKIIAQEYGESMAQFLKDQAMLLDEKNAVGLITALLESYAVMKNCPIPLAPFEMAFIKTFATA